MPDTSDTKAAKLEKNQPSAATEPRNSPPPADPDPEPRIEGGQPIEPVDKRPRVGSVKPEDYPEEGRAGIAPTPGS